MNEATPGRDPGLRDDELARHLARRADAPRTGEQWTQTRLLPAIRVRLGQRSETVRPRMRPLGAVVPGMVAVVVVFTIVAAWAAGVLEPRGGPGSVGSAPTPSAVGASAEPTISPTIDASPTPPPTPIPPKRIPSAPDVRPATWELVPGEQPQGDARAFRVFVTEIACASGRSPEGRIVGPTIGYRTEAVEISFGVRRLPVPQDCQSAMPFPVTVQLGEPVGSRVLLDGGVTPAEERRARPLPALQDEATQTADGFSLSIGSSKTVWSVDEPVQITASIVYEGPRDSVVVRRQEPLIGFGIDQLDGYQSVDVSTVLECREVRLDRDKRIVQSLVKQLPPGTWRIWASSRDRPCPRLGGPDPVHLLASIVIRTE